MEYLPEINLNKLSRNLFEKPLSKKEDLSKEDFKYLYLELNLSSKQICSILNYPYYKFKSLSKKYDLYKPKDLTLKHRENTCLKKYGVKNISKSEYFKNLWKEKGKDWIDSQHKKMKEKYGYTNNFSNTEKMKNAYLNKLGVTNPAKLSSVIKKRKESQKIKFKGKLFFQTEICREKCISKKANEKRFKTLKEHKNINISKPETRIYNMLLTKFPDTIHQYRSKEYPFNCDFYIPSLDTYIEYQGSWTHGGHPYNKNDIKDLDKLKKWRENASIKEEETNKRSFYSSAVYTWTDLDVRKREIACKNNLKYLEFFNEEDFMDWFNNK